jgi:hypothetical protein
VTASSADILKLAFARWWFKGTRPFYMFISTLSRPLRQAQCELCQGGSRPATPAAMAGVRTKLRKMAKNRPKRPFFIFLSRQHFSLCSMMLGINCEKVEKNLAGDVKKPAKSQFHIGRDLAAL